MSSESALVRELRQENARLRSDADKWREKCIAFLSSYQDDAETINALKSQVEAIESRVNKVEPRIQALESRVQTLEARPKRSKSVTPSRNTVFDALVNDIIRNAQEGRSTN